MKWPDVCAMQPIDFLKNDQRNSLGAQGLKLASSNRFPHDGKVPESTSADNMAFFKSRIHTMNKDMVLLDTNKQLLTFVAGGTVSLLQIDLAKEFSGLRVLNMESPRRSNIQFLLENG